MTATDEMRRLLDGRGVAWRAAYYSPENVTEFKVGGIRFRYIESSKYDDFCWIDTDRSITPQQAVDVTLGRGTCNADETDTWECVRDDLGGYGKTLTVHVMECTECGHTYEYVNGSYEFCPRCGRKVVDA